jgi:chemotaxis methyl-accepting protein methylase
MSEKTEKQTERINEHFQKTDHSSMKSSDLSDVLDRRNMMLPGNTTTKTIRYIKFSELSGDVLEHLKDEQRNTYGIQQVLTLLELNKGHDFSAYKKSTITSRINRRLAFHKHNNYAEYAAYIRNNPAEIDLLFDELLIGVTKFFRDAKAFDALESKLADLIQHKKNNEPIRIWVTGCSTGQEAYSIAMLVDECLEKSHKKKYLKVQIFATDLSAKAVEQGRKGVYYENSVADISKARIKKFFTKTDDAYQVKQELRNMIVFAQHNLIKDTPFTRLDLLCVRNVMIYFTAELQKKIAPILHYALNDQGILFTGMAETISGLADLFTSINDKWKIFERKEKTGVNNTASVITPKLGVQLAKANKIPPILPAQSNQVKQLQQKFMDTQQQLTAAIKHMEEVIAEIKQAGEDDIALNEQLLPLNIQYAYISNELEQLNSNIKSLLDINEITAFK